jgi:SET family sugar efflux transporter-like MFS transporter
LRLAGSSVASEAGPLAAAIGAYGVLSAFLSTTTSLFLTTAVHVAPLLIGLFFAGRGVVSIALNLGVGPISDRLPDRRLLVVIAGIGGAIGGVCFAVLRDYIAVLLSGVVFFAIVALGFSQLFAYANEFARARGRPVTVFTSLLRAVFTASWVIGPPAGFYLLTRYGFGPLYLGVGGLSLLMAALGWSLRPLPAVTGPAVTGPVQAPRAGRPRRGHAPFAAFSALPARTWLLLGAVVALGVINQMYAIDVPLYVTRTLHLDARIVGWMAGLGAAMEVPVIIVAARLADRLGKLRLVVASAAGATVFFCLLPLTRSAVALLALQVLNAAWTAVALSIPMVMVQEEARGGAGAASALYSSAFMSAGVLAGAITGVTTAAIGFGNVFWVCAALAAVAAGLLLARGRASSAVPAIPGGPCPGKHARAGTRLVTNSCQPPMSAEAT